MNKLLLLGGGLALASLAPPIYKTLPHQRFGYHIDCQSLLPSVQGDH